jgi:hypothetical protein
LLLGDAGGVIQNGGGFFLFLLNKYTVTSAGFYSGLAAFSG